MRKLYFIAFLVLLLSLSAIAIASASDDPIGGCPDDFHLHQAADHDEHHGPHRHVGSDTDFNDDGWICVKHAADESIHVHIDNKKPLP
jgi:hypothetical protein